MFIGHFAVGLAARRVVPWVPLVVLFAAAQFADLLWPFLVAVGAEQVRIERGNTAVTPLDFVSYPYSHSLLMLCVWGILFGAAYTGRRVGADPRVSPGADTQVGPYRDGIVIAALVVSHWILDFVTHRPDMPLYPSGPKVGLGLWNSVPWTVVTEVAMFGAGVSVYLGATRARDRIGHWGFLSLVAFLLVAYAANIVGPPPPSIPALWLTAIAGGAVLLVWAAWADRHRDVIL